MDEDFHIMPDMKMKPLFSEHFGEDLINALHRISNQIAGVAEKFSAVAETLAELKAVVRSEQTAEKPDETQPDVIRSSAKHTASLFVGRDRFICIAKGGKVYRVRVIITPETARKLGVEHDSPGMIHSNYSVSNVTDQARGVYWEAFHKEFKLQKDRSDFKESQSVRWKIFEAVLDGKRLRRGCLIAMSVR